MSVACISQIQEILLFTVLLTSHPTYDPSGWGDPNLDYLSQENLVA